MFKLFYWESNSEFVSSSSSWMHSRGGRGIELQTSMHVRIAGPGEMAHCERQKRNERCSLQHTRSAPVHPRNSNVVHPRKPATIHRWL